MNRRDFLKFLGGAAAAASVAPKLLAEVIDGEQAYPVTCPGPFGGAVIHAVPVENDGFIVLDEGMNIQEAIDALPREGGTVYIPSGTYIHGQAISIPGDVRLVAEGSVTISACSFKAESRSQWDSPIVLLMEENEKVWITGNFFNCEGLSPVNWFASPVGHHLADLKAKMQRLYLKVKQMVI